MVVTGIPSDPSSTILTLASTVQPLELLVLEIHGSVFFLCTYLWNLDPDSRRVSMLRASPNNEAQLAEQFVSSCHPWSSGGRLFFVATSNGEALLPTMYCRPRSVPTIFPVDPNALPCRFGSIRTQVTLDLVTASVDLFSTGDPSSYLNRVEDSSGSAGS